jgi:branched-chain amino acid transport system substrate-binding protein
MSPEQQISGSYLLPSSDVYALGLVMFEMLAGRSFKNLRPGSHLKNLVPSAPDWLDDLLDRMLSKDPDARPWDGAEVAEALRKGFAGEQEPKTETIEKPVNKAANVREEYSVQEKNADHIGAQSSTASQPNEAAGTISVSHERDIRPISTNFDSRENTKAKRNSKNLWWILLPISLLFVLVAVLLPQNGSLNNGSTPVQPTTGEQAQNTGASQPQSTEPLKIAILAPLTGPVPSFGVSTKEGALLAIDEWNKIGGVLGRKIIPIIEDSQCTADPAVNAANKVINEDGVKYIIGEVCSRASIPVSEIANAKKVVQISGTATSPSVTLDASGNVKPFSFVACFNDEVQGKAQAKFASESLKAKTAFIMYDNDNDYVKGLSVYFEKYFTASGGKIVGKGTYTSKDTDFSAILTKIKNTNPGVIVLPDYYNIANLVVKQARQKGIKSPFIGGDGWDSPDLDPVATSGSYFTNHYAPDEDRGKVITFVKDYGEMYQNDNGSAKTPDAISALTYDATNIMIEGIARAGVDDSTEVAKSIASGQFEAVSGSISFDAYHSPIKPVMVFSVKNSGVAFETQVIP